MMPPNCRRIRRTAGTCLRDLQQVRPRYRKRSPANEGMRAAPRFPNYKAFCATLSRACNLPRVLRATSPSPSPECDRNRAAFLAEGSAAKLVRRLPNNEARY